MNVMSEHRDNPTPAQRLMVLQIISVAMMFGVVMFGLISVFVLKAFQQPPGWSTISVVAAGFAVIAFVMHLVVPGAVAASVLKQGSTSAANGVGALAAAYQTRHIVKLAILEGAAFFALVAGIMEHHPWTLAIAAALVLVMLAEFPTQTRLNHWMESRQDSLGGRPLDS